MVSDQEPRYRFRDSNGNITGTVFERGGELVVQEGTSGTENELVLQSDGTVQAKRLAGGYLYAGAFDGSDPDARLDNALAAANDGERIQLENAVYSGRTVTKGVHLYGTGSKYGGTRLSGTLTLGTSASVGNIDLETDKIVHDGGFGEIERVRAGVIQINEDNVTVHDGSKVDVTVASSSRGSIVDNLGDQSTVTDNGAGTIVGDVK